MKTRLFFLLVLLYGCNSTDENHKAGGQDSAAIKNDSSVASNTKAVMPTDTAVKKPSLFDSTSGYLLTFKNDSVDQKMKVVKKKKKVMEFSLITTNTAKKISDTISGIMTYSEPGGDESDAADDGAGFFYENWNFRGIQGCQLNFRVADSVKYIRIQDFDCSKAYKTSSPLETRHVLKRVDIR